MLPELLKSSLKPYNRLLSLGLMPSGILYSKLIPPEYISRINFIFYIIKALIISVCYDCLAP